jgi:hypothetical protein
MAFKPFTKKEAPSSKTDAKMPPWMGKKAAPAKTKKPMPKGKKC